jgi:VanZ family protein
MNDQWRLGLGLAASGLVAMVVIVGSLTPSQSLPVQTWPDKVLHLQAYFALVLPVCMARAGAWRWVVPLAVVLGGAIELVQPTVGRSADWLDLGANTLGASLGAALPGAWRWLVR